MVAPPRLSDAVTELLARIGRAGDFGVAKLAGDASLRLYFRVTAGDRTFVAMLLPEAGPSSKAEEITKTSRPVTELPFVDVQRYFRSRGVRVPEIHGHDANRGVLLLEDFGDAVLCDVLQTAGAPETRAFYETALEELERIAVIPADADRSRSILFARSFDRDLYNWEFLHFVEYALDKRLKQPPKGRDRERILHALYGLSDEYLGWENLAAHRDYHSKNLVVLGPRKLGVLDFQDALLAPLFYDLASLLRDSYVTLERKLQNDLVEQYRLRMKERGFRNAESKDSFRRAFDLMGTHRNLKAAGRFFYIDEVKKNPSYLQYVPRSLNYVAETLQSYPELSELKELMLPHFDELRAACRK